MPSFSRRCAVIATVMGLSLPFVPSLHAQNPTRVVRLSRAEGQVLVSHPGSDAWEEAPVNLPLQEGDTLATQAGLAEIEFENGATGYLAENSVLQFIQLSFADAGKVTALQLSQGAGTFYANLASQDSFRLQTSVFEVALPERAEFRVDAFSDGAAVEVFLGNVTVSTTKASATLEKGQSVAVHDRDLQDLNNISLLPEEDAFDQWVTEEGEIIRSGTKNTFSYISSPNYYGLADLAIYGNWINLAGLGMSWRPFSTGLSWTPYINGVWVQDARLGWIWVSNEAWGWMPYHFGSWTLSPVLGWVWVPGGPAGLQHWEPACVNWVNVGGRTAWVARSPLDREGAPANLQKGVVTRAERSATNANASNELVTGKELQSATTLKAPPAGFVAPHSPAPLRSRESLPIQAAPATAKDSTIVFDRGTRTYINGDSGATVEKHAPVPPPALMPKLEAGNEAPRLPTPSTLPGQIPANRVFMPPRNLPPQPVDKSGSVITAPPARTVPPAPVGAQHPLAPVAPPRQVVPPPAPPQPPSAPTQPPASRSTAQPPSAPRAAPAQPPATSQPQAPARPH